MWVTQWMFDNKLDGQLRECFGSNLGKLKVSTTVAEWNPAEIEGEVGPAIDTTQ